MPRAGSGFTAVTITKEVRSDLDKLAIMLSMRVGRRLALGEAISEARKLIEKLIEGLPPDV